MTRASPQRPPCSCSPCRVWPIRHLWRRSGVTASTAVRRRASTGKAMSDRVELIWYGDDAPWYDHGPQHPLRPARVILTRDLIKAYGVVDGERVVETPARDATDEEIGLVHSDRYIDAVKRAGHGERGEWSQFGFGPGDNPIFPRMHESSSRVVGASLVA